MHRGIEYKHNKVPKTRNLAEKDKGPITTLMIRNIPNRYSQKQLVMELESVGFRRNDGQSEHKQLNESELKIEGEREMRFDFVYLPMDMSTDANVGYAFVNFTD